MSLACIGDLHGDFDILVGLDALLPDNVTAVIQVGDFGVYPSTLPLIARLKPKLPTYFIDGNHEDHRLIAHDHAEIVEIVPNLWYVPRGMVLTLDGRRVGFLGGADSVDKQYSTDYERITGKQRWFPQETVMPEQLDRLSRASAAVGGLDLVITHGPPQRAIEAHFDPHDLARFGLPPTWKSPSAILVDEWYYGLPERPPLVCGHMHRKVTHDGVRMLDIEEVYVV